MQNHAMQSRPIPSRAVTERSTAGAAMSEEVLPPIGLEIEIKE